MRLWVKMQDTGEHNGYFNYSITYISKYLHDKAEYMSQLRVCQERLCCCRSGMESAAVDDDICILKHETAYGPTESPVSVCAGDESVASHFALVTAYEDIKKRLRDTEKENALLRRKVKQLEDKVCSASPDWAQLVSSVSDVSEMLNVFVVFPPAALPPRRPSGRRTAVHEQSLQCVPRYLYREGGLTVGAEQTGKCSSNTWFIICAHGDSVVVMCSRGKRKATWRDVWQSSYRPESLNYCNCAQR